MSLLTTRQRDLLHLLFSADAPSGAADFAEQMGLTPRQVNYDLKAVKQWLSQRDVGLKITPGVGVDLDCSRERQSELISELQSTTNFQLVLSTGQRQQLIALLLLVATEPMILFQLQQLLQMSRTTVLKDLDAIESWFETMGATLERRPNFGLWLACSEQQRRQMIAALLWGETSFGPALTEISHKEGLVFQLRHDADLLPIVGRVKRILDGWELKRTLGLVAYAEAQLGGRFSDDAVLHLALMLAIQAQRVAGGRYVTVAQETLGWLQALPLWPIGIEIASRLGWRGQKTWPDGEIASVLMHILATPLNERWPGDLELDSTFTELIERLVQHTADAYGFPNLVQDKTLHDGLMSHVIPACFRLKFQLWMPATLSVPRLANTYVVEHKLADELAELVAEHAHMRLAAEDINGIALMLRAAFIRERPNRQHRVFVVCPSGMATAQLLVARLQARFPHLRPLDVLSLRELSSARASVADLIITTVPLPDGLIDPSKTIRVHPLLLPEDVEAITQWLV